MDDGPPLSVLLVDDHALVRRGLRELLADEFPGAVFTEAGSGPEAVEKIRNTVFTLVVLDLSIPGRDGLDVLKEFHERLLRAGAAGYITKESAPEELSKAIRKVLSGGRYISPSLAERLATTLAGDTCRPLHESLSDRELQVLRMVAGGESIKQIGVLLALSEKTISTYRTRILEKMDMKTTANLIRYALRAGLVE